MAHFENLDEKHPYYLIAAFRMSQKPEAKEVTVARFYWKFAAFNFINKRWNEMFMCVRFALMEELALHFSANSSVAISYALFWSHKPCFSVIRIHVDVCDRTIIPKNFPTCFFLFILSQSLYIFILFWVVWNILLTVLFLNGHNNKINVFKTFENATTYV